MLRSIAVIFLLALIFPAHTAISPEALEFFENRIRPVLAQDCYECHRTGGKKKGGLVLDSREGLLRGGGSGPAIVPGNPRESLLIKAIRHEVEDVEMPKSRAKLEDSVIADFEKWVKIGAPDPRDVPASEQQIAADSSWEAVLNRRKQWWSFQPIKKVSPPENEAKHPIDKFIRARLAQEKLEPSSKAVREVLIRRLSFALRGLPPTVDELHREASLETIVDGFLDSPRFGERWARHWMDWYRYADSHGSEGDATIPFSWRYRDYLIRALNNDVPYDQLLREQVAGDQLKNPRVNRDLALNESALGIGHLRMVFHGFAPTDALEEKVRFVDDEINVVSKAALGLTVSCARCHDHKFDAISQADYTAWFATFASGAPATIGVNMDSTDARENLDRIKAEIKSALVQEWLKDAATNPATAMNVASNSELKFEKRWDLTKAEGLGEWHRDGQVKWRPAGGFTIAASGESVVSAILPAGVYSHSTSTKDRAVLISPKFRLNGKYDLWVRAAGDGGAVVRYVVENYPRDGSIYPVTRLNGGQWTWIKQSLAYWEGDRVHVEISTSADQAVLADANSTRSWFGVREVMFVPQGSPSPLNSTNSGALRHTLQAWERNELDDGGAVFLNQALRGGTLRNKLSDLEKVAPFLERWREAEGKLPAPIRAPGLIETEDADQPLYVRGDHKKPAQIVPRHFMEAIDAKPYNKNVNARLQLAENLVRSDNPLASRVIVNRVWHHLFGRGIVGTPDNFGRLGQQPSHPELLDYLANWFVENGSSIKKLIRFVVTSETWQAVSEPSSAAREKDPDNIYLSHFSVRRLEAEAIRDALLAISGELNEEMYGPPIVGKTPRRSVYLRVRRNDLDPFMTAFDAPAPASTTGKRDVTNVPGQSLLLLNDPFVMRLAESWAGNGKGNVTNRVIRMFEEALGREPSDLEIERCVTMLGHFSGARGELLSEQRARQERVDHESRVLEKLKKTAKGRLLANRPDRPAGPMATILWDAKNGFGALKGNARVQNDELVLDGKSYAVTEPLNVSLKAKTLEAWVRLGNLDQQGGGALTIQDLEGNVFDSIVFGEQQPKRWIAGSDFFRRTKSFNGPDETETNYVQMAIVYSEDGTVTAYRNGVAYGTAYKSDAAATFEAGKAQALFGLRHGEPGGNRLFTGAIRRAALFDRALNTEEIKALATGDPTYVSTNNLLAAMTAEERDEFARAEKTIRELQQMMNEMERRRGLESEWADLAHAIFNMKEFVYVR
jgi:hypothetical protein